MSWVSIPDVGSMNVQECVCSQRTVLHVQQWAAWELPSEIHQTWTAPKHLGSQIPEKRHLQKHTTTLTKHLNHFNIYFYTHFNSEHYNQKSNFFKTSISCPQIFLGSIFCCSYVQCCEGNKKIQQWTLSMQVNRGIDLHLPQGGTMWHLYIYMHYQWMQACKLSYTNI